MNIQQLRDDAERLREQYVDNEADSRVADCAEAAEMLKHEIDELNDALREALGILDYEATTLEQEVADLHNEQAYALTSTLDVKAKHKELLAMDDAVDEEYGCTTGSTATKLKQQYSSFVYDLLDEIEAKQGAKQEEKQEVASTSKPPSTAKEMLSVLDTFLSLRTQASRHVASILSALRGPDSDADSEGKRTTTMLIRSAAFPKLWCRGESAFLGAANTSYAWATLRGVEQDIEYDDMHIINDHFRDHASGAMKSLQSLGLLNENGSIPAEDAASVAEQTEEEARIDSLSKEELLKKYDAMGEQRPWGGCTCASCLSWYRDYLKAQISK